MRSEALSSQLQNRWVYTETHVKAYRRIVSVAEIKGKLRALDLKSEDVRNAIGSAENAASLFASQLATDYE